MNKPLDRAVAVKHARLAQAAAAALALAGGGLAVFGLPGARAPEPPPQALELREVSLTTSAAGPLAGLAPVDFGAVSGRMGLLNNAPKAETPAVRVDESPTAPPPAPPPPPPPVRYLGMVTLGGVRLALVHDGTKQRFVGVGALLSDGRKIKLIEADRLVLEGPGGDEEIALAPRSGDLLTHASPTAMAGKAGGPGRTPGDVPFGTQPLGAPGTIAHPGGTNPTGASAAAAAARARAMADLAAKRRAEGRAEGKGEDADLKGVVRDAKGRVVKDLTQDVRADELRDKLKASGRFTSKDELEAALREMLDHERDAKSGNEEGSPK